MILWSLRSSERRTVQIPRGNFWKMGHSEKQYNWAGPLKTFLMHADGYKTSRQSKSRPSSPCGCRIIPAMGMATCFLNEDLAQELWGPKPFSSRRPVSQTSMTLSITRKMDIIPLLKLTGKCSCHRIPHLSQPVSKCWNPIISYRSITTVSSGKV